MKRDDEGRTGKGEARTTADITENVSKQPTETDDITDDITRAGTARAVWSSRVMTKREREHLTGKQSRQRS